MQRVLAFVLLISFVGSEAFDCKVDRIVQKSCHEVVQCKNGKPVSTTCIAGFVMNFQKMTCEPLEKAPPPCGKAVDCSGKKNGKYAEINQHCAIYYTCVSQKFAGHNVCPAGLVFSEADQACDWPTNVVKPCGTKAKKLFFDVKS